MKDTSLQETCPFDALFVKCPLNKGHLHLKYKFVSPNDVRYKEVPLYCLLLYCTLVRRVSLRILSVSCSVSDKSVTSENNFGLIQWLSKWLSFIELNTTSSVRGRIPGSFAVPN